jgi:chaperonin GroEL
LASGIAVISVGGATQIEMIEKKHRVEDALEAVKSAQEEGIVVGGGMALLKVASTVDPLKFYPAGGAAIHGMHIVLKAVEAPLRQMVENAGGMPDVVLNAAKDLEDGQGFDLLHDFGKCEAVDMFECGIIDPLKVVRSALQNAASAASTLITTSHAIIAK